MAIIKLVNWYTNLVNLIDERRTTPFEPGYHDCGLWASDCVKAMTGVDLAAQFRGQYTTIEEGLALLQAAGYADQVEFAAAEFRECGPTYVQSGDIAAISTPIGWATGVVMGHIVYVVTPGDGGLGILSISRVERAFQIPVQGELDEA